MCFGTREAHREARNAARAWPPRAAQPRSSKPIWPAQPRRQQGHPRWHLRLRWNSSAASGHGHRWCGRSHLLHVRCASISCGREAWARRRTCRMPSGVVRPIRCAIAVVFAAQRHEVALHAGCAGRSSTRPDGERPPIMHTAARCDALVYKSIEATSATVCRALKSRAN